MTELQAYLGRWVSKLVYIRLKRPCRPYSAIRRCYTKKYKHIWDLNYYHCFLPNVAETLAPLHGLLKKGVAWHWGNGQQSAFEASKDLQSEQVLMHYQPDVDLVVSCDFLGFGLGAVLSHRFPDGTERPISYASRFLSAEEKNYSALDREACVVMFSVRKFHRYLLARKFSILTDHNPLIYLFSERKATP